jgi:ribosomal protein S8E
MSAIAAAFDTLFADPNMARDAVFTPSNGIAVRVRIVVRRPDRVSEFGETRLHAQTTIIDIRVADAPALASGDAFEIGAESFVVQGEPQRDAERLIWTAELRSA